MSKAQTRSLYVIDADLSTWPEVAVYAFDSESGALTRVSPPIVGEAFNFYEVSVVGDRGSWWLPVAPQSAVPRAWLADALGGVEALEVEPASAGIWTGTPTEAVVRPSCAFWWIPSATLSDNGIYVPARNVGAVRGAAPIVAPPASETTKPPIAAGADPEPAIETRRGGVTLRLGTRVRPVTLRVGGGESTPRRA